MIHLVHKAMDEKNNTRMTLLALSYSSDRKLRKLQKISNGLKKES
jgi:hypothetical protein